MKQPRCALAATIFFTRLTLSGMLRALGKPFLTSAVRRPYVSCGEGTQVLRRSRALGADQRAPRPTGVPREHCLRCKGSQCNAQPGTQPYAGAGGRHLGEALRVVAVEAVAEADPRALGVRGPARAAVAVEEPPEPRVRGSVQDLVGGWWLEV